MSYCNEINSCIQLQKEIKWNIFEPFLYFHMYALFFTKTIIESNVVIEYNKCYPWYEQNIPHRKYLIYTWVHFVVVIYSKSIKLFIHIYIYLCIYVCIYNIGKCLIHIYIHVYILYRKERLVWEIQI